MQSIMKKIFLLVLLLYTPLFSSIDEQIEAIQNASDKERFKMMNRFKKEVIKLQEEERIEAMKKLISITESNNSKEVMEELKHNSNDKNSSYEESKNNILEEHIEDTINNEMEENADLEDKEEGGGYD